MSSRRGAKVPGLAGATIAVAVLALGAVLLLATRDPAAEQRPRALLAQSLHEEDDLSEAELAGRLSHAIDAHEKCRRHWPHLEKLEAAQEIRVHDARNNLEVANRAMERSRKELRDAEGLVLAARQEHQSYEAQRVAFQSFKSDYDQRTLAMKGSAPTAQRLHEQRSEPAALSPTQPEAELEADASRLELAQKREMEHESRAMAELKQRNAAELKASMPARTQDLAQLEPRRPRPVLTKVISSGIAVPGNQPLAARKKAARKARVASANKAASLIAEEAKLKGDEIKAFAELPTEEKMSKEIERNLARQRRRENMERSRMLITRKHVRYLERREADDVLAGMAKKVQLAKAQQSLANVNFHITEHKIREESKELATLRNEERLGPKDTAKLSAVKASLRRLKKRRPTALAGEKARETELVQIDQLAARRGKRGRSQSVEGSRTKQGKQESRDQLRKEVEESRKELKSIRNQLLAVQSRLSVQQQVHPRKPVQQQLTSRHHDLDNSQQLLRDSNFQPTMALYNVYEEKLTALREERKKADGLLAKAERMLNIARIDSLHAAKTKKAALEELKYATSKLRRYQDLRSKSQHCQMDAVSMRLGRSCLAMISVWNARRIMLRRLACLGCLC